MEAPCRQVAIYADEDGDGRPGSTDEPELLCEDEVVPDGYTSSRLEDCDPTDPEVWQHSCADRDEDGAVSSSDSFCTGDEPPAFAKACPRILEWTPDPGPYDCDDSDPARIDYFYADGDGDGHGAGASVCGNVGDGWSAYSGDCDDADPATYPGAPEQPDDGFDNDCDGTDSPWCLPDSLDQFDWRETSVDVPCEPNLALASVTCSGCGHPFGTLAIENRGTLPFRGEIVLDAFVESGAEPYPFPQARLVDLAPGARQVFAGFPYAGSFALALSTDAGADCDPTDNSAHIDTGHCL
jgi:hypothetical protein